MNSGRHRRRRRLLDPVQRIAACVLATGLVMLLLAAFRSPADALINTTDDGRDQITGVGTAQSALTVKWSDGLLGADNKTVVAPRAQGQMNSDFYNGTYGEFKNLQVTVSQTENLVHQAIAVSWSGGTQTSSDLNSDYLQIMQCYGDATDGPQPEDCEYGASGLLQGSGTNAFVGSRSGSRCPAAPALLGCDPLETTTNGHSAPGASSANYFVPFAPVDTSDRLFNTPDSGFTSSYYDQFTSNEVQQAVTGADGTGLQYFQVLPSTQAPALGCGATEATNGKTRDCWLVIVPRGEYKPNGFHVSGFSGPGAYVTDSPLGASNWAQRIQIHLGFSPIQKSCPIGSADERQTVGTEMVAAAVFSWQLELNQQANCKTIYGYTSTPEATNTTQLAAGTSGGAAGLAFTTIPIGSEAGDGAASPNNIVYAPVAVAATELGFQINLNTGYISTPVKLTPRLMAKALTQSYLADLPQYTSNDPTHGPAPDWAVHNPYSILIDPEFRRLNPEIPTSTGSGSPLAPLLAQDHSALNRQLWQWIIADPAAREWLGGQPDENGMVVNPAYSSLNLADQASDSFPRAEPACHDTGQGSIARPSIRCTLDLLPYVQDFEDAAVRIRAANNPEGAAWDPSKTGPDGEAGWWANGSKEAAGHIFLWGLTDSASSASFGLVPAQLCAADGSNCVGPTDTSVGAAMSVATADSSGLLHIDPSTVPAGAYPLVSVSYAAVRTDDDRAAIKDYASLLDFATTTGQTPGEGPGQLPRGYLPLSDNLKSVAAKTVASLRLLAGMTTSPSSSPTPTRTSTATPNVPRPSSSSSTPRPGNRTESATSGPHVVSSVTPPPAPARTPITAPAAPATSTVTGGPATVVPGGGMIVVSATPRQAAPTSRYAPLVVVGAGLVGLVGAPLARGIGRRSGRKK